MTTITATTRTPTPQNTLSSSSTSSSIKCVSPHVVAGNKNSYVVFEAIYYDNGRANGTAQNHSNQLVLAKVKNNNNNNQNNTNNNNNAPSSGKKNEAKNVTAPILVTSVSTPLTSVLQCNSNNTVSTVNCGTIVKKPSIILLTQASLSKLLSTSDLNMINNNNNNNNNSNASQNNNNNNTTTHIHNVNANVHVNHVHSHHQHETSNRSKCNITINTTTNPNPSTVTQNNSQLTSVLMINSTSTIETSAGVVTLTSASAPNRDLSDDAAKTNNSQVKSNCDVI